MTEAVAGNAKQQPNFYQKTQIQQVRRDPTIAVLLALNSPGACGERRQPVGRVHESIPVRVQITSFPARIPVHCTLVLHDLYYMPRIRQRRGRESGAIVVISCFVGSMHTHAGGEARRREERERDAE